MVSVSGAAGEHVLVADRVVPLGTSASAYSLKLPAGAVGHRLISVSQTEADIELQVSNATGRRWSFDAPGRRASEERGCVFDDGRGLTVEVRFPGRTQASRKALQLKVFAVQGSATIPRGSEVEAECLEAQAALVDSRRPAGELAVDFERAAVIWEKRGQISRAATARLQSAWLLARRTPDHVAALARGQQARAAFKAAGDARGEALAILQMTVPRVELMSAGLDAQGRETTNHTAISDALATDLRTAITTFDSASLPYFGGMARTQLANNYYLDDDLDSAIHLLGEAAEKYRVSDAADGLARALANRCFMLFQRGRYREAAEAFDQVLSSGATRDFPEVTADILDNSATTQAAVGNYDKALSQFVQALSIHEAVKDASGMARSFNGLASTYLSLGNSRAAIEYAQRARSLLEARDTHGQLSAEPARLNSLLLSGEAHRELGDFPAAQAAHREVLALAHTDLGKARAQLELARDALDAGHGARALQVLAAMPPMNASWGTLPRQQSLRRGQALLVAGQTANAIVELTALRGQFAQLGAPEFELEVLEALARAQLQTGRVQQALATSELGVAQLQALRLESGDPDKRARLNDVYRTTYTLQVDALHAVRSGENDGVKRQRLEARIFAAADAARAGLTRAAQSPPAQTAGARHQLAAEISLRQKVLSGLETTQASPQRAAVLRRELADLRARFDAAAPARDTPLPRFSERDYAADGLRADTAVLMYMQSAGELRRYLITRDSIRELESRRLTQVTQLVREAFASLSVPPASIRSNDAIPSLRALSDLLLPSGQMLEGRRQLIVVSDNATARIPFAALAGSRREYQPLIQSHDVGSALTLRDALAIARMTDSESKIDLSRTALFSDPVFSALDDRVAVRNKPTENELLLTRLAGTAAEARAIEASLPKGYVSSFSGFSATREALLAKAAHASVLHLATHAIASDRWPNGSGLMMTALSRDGAMLNGYVSTLDLLSRGSTAHLVVLSACETARGETGSGESVAGLARAVLGGGARRVVASHWAVEDTVTARIMRTFYARLAAGDSVSRALSGAQRAVYADKRLSSPARWAAFVVYERGTLD
jgi:CHAT domain-containing protein